jgi:uncharacterized phiE125 gp8 family phage protein
MAEPITPTEAKAQCRMADDTSEDTFITGLIAPARAYVERVGRFFFIATARTETFSQWGDFLEIYRRPIASVDEIAYADESGGDATYDSPVVDLNRFPLRIYPAIDGSGFPTLGDGGAITVTYTSGALSATSEEYLIGKRAMLLLIGHWFEFREAAQSGIVSGEIAFAISSLLDELRPISAY